MENKRQNLDSDPQNPIAKKQRSIASFFGGSSTLNLSPVTNKEKKQLSVGQPRKLQGSTAEKWKTTSLAKYSAEEWLIVNIDASTKLVGSMNCKICQQFEDRISSIKGFAYNWLREGSKRLLLHAAIEHAEGEPHKKAFDLYLRSRGLTTHERTELLEPSHSQRGIIHGIDNMNQKDFEFTKKKFETAYFVVKEELPLSKFPKILELEEKHGVLLGNAYRNSMSGALIIDYIADSLSRDLRKHLEHTNFFSILTDGSTDASIIEKEAIFVITFDPSPAGSDKIGIKITFLELADLSNADASGVLKSIKTSFEKLGIDDMRKLVGFGSDGASVNAAYFTEKKQIEKDYFKQIIHGLFFW